MQSYRVASWLYVVLGSLVLPVMILDFGWYGLKLAAVWIALLGASAPLMVIQLYGLRRVLRERAGFTATNNLLTWYWVLHLLSLAMLAIGVGLYLSREWSSGLWAFVLGAPALVGLGVGLAIVELMLGGRIGQCPDPLFGLRRALQLGFTALGILELASMLTFLTLPIYMVVAVALMLLIALIIEKHARSQPLPDFRRRHVWAAYLLATALALGLPLVTALPLLSGGPVDVPAFDDEDQG